MKLSLFVLGLSLVFPTARAMPTADTVVLLHGMGRSQLSMLRLATELKRDGYRVINATYPSRTRSVEQLATEWLPAKLAAIEPGSRVHFVTHSMGGIVVRAWQREVAASRVPPVNLGRVVMIAPPNAGSEIPDRFADFPPFRWCTGINGARLGTATDALPRSLGPWIQSGLGAGELGIIAGSRTDNPLLSRVIAGPNDGRVSVASTHLDGERDHVVLPASHPWLLWRRDAIAHVRTFLAQGAFASAAKSNAR